MISVPPRWYGWTFSRTLASFARTHLLRSGLQSGLFESLRRPQTASRLALELQLAPDLLQSWLVAAEAQGLVRCVGKGRRAYRVAGLARWILEAPHSDSLSASLELAIESCGHVFERIPELIRGSERPDFGSPAEAQRIAEAARVVERSGVEALARIPRVRVAKRVLDIGCGYATYLRRFLLQYRDAHGLGIEQDSAVAEIARRNLEEAGLIRRAQIQVGDFMNLDLAPGSFDLITLNNNIYYFAPNDVDALFERVFSRLTAGGVVAIQTPTISSRRAARISGLTANLAAFDLYLRAHSNLYGLPNLPELHANLQRVGFRPIGETAFLPGGTARYVWARAPDS